MLGETIRRGELAVTRAAIESARHAGSVAEPVEPLIPHRLTDRQP